MSFSPEFLQTLLASVIGAILTLVGIYFTHRLGLRTQKEERHRNAQYLAIRVICILDPFINACLEAVQDNGIPDQNGEYRPEVSAPTIAFPDDLDWRSVKPDLMYRIIGFPNEVAIAQQAVDFVASNTDSPPDHDEYFTERALQFSKLGLVAYELATDIRETYGVKALDYGDWQPKEIFEKKVTAIERRYEENAARMNEKMQALKATFGIAHETGQGSRPQESSNESGSS